jgi:hypothetical protein
LDFTAKIGDLNRLLENCADKKKKIKQVIKDIYNDSNTLNLIICICKMHLRCLFSLAKNRNSDVTNKFFQLRIVEVFVRELDLEHEANENSYKLQKYYESCKNTDKEQKDKQKMDSLIKEKAMKEIENAINTKLEPLQDSTPIEETKVENSPAKDPNAKFKGIFANKFKPKPKVQENVITEQDSTTIKELREDLDDQNSQTKSENITGSEEISGTQTKKNPFNFLKKPKELNMVKIASSSQNSEIINMIDKTQTPVFSVDMRLGDKFNELAQNQRDQLENISERKENISSRIKSSGRDSFNEDNDSFDDVPLCEFMPKDKRYKDKIPLLVDIPENNIPMENQKDEKKDKPKVSFNTIFKKNQPPGQLSQNEKQERKELSNQENNAGNSPKKEILKNKQVEEKKDLQVEKKKEAPKTNFAAIFKNRKLPFTKLQEIIEVNNVPEETKIEESVQDISKRDSNYNIDDDEFDDIPLCENPKKELHKSIPKLEIPHKGRAAGGEEMHEETKSNISFNYQNNSVKKKNSSNEESFNEDNEEFDDIPLCEHLPKNKAYKDTIPKLQLIEDNLPDDNNTNQPNKNKSNTDIIKVNSSNPLHKSVMKNNKLTVNKSGILTEFNLGEGERPTMGHERKRSMPQNNLISLEDDKKKKSNV